MSMNKEIRSPGPDRELTAAGREMYNEFQEEVSRQSTELGIDPEAIFQ